ncbi:deSI-like protein [Aureococcus anophagefferens]|nr:deSI-like protein [Aureococcus anophagefferens]
MEANVEHHMGVYGGWESKFARSASPEPRGRAFAGPCVYVNVYDITDIGMCVDMAETMISLNKRLLGAWDGGIFHAGVELAGVEYSYGYCDRGTGVFTNDPLDAYGASHRSRVPMGRCGLDARAIERRLARLVALWQGNTYALLTRNCCHFCDALCAELGVGPIPAWVNGLARHHRAGDLGRSRRGTSALPLEALEEYKDALGSDSDDDDDDGVHRRGQLRGRPAASTRTSPSTTTTTSPTTRRARAPRATAGRRRGGARGGRRRLAVASGGRARGPEPAARPPPDAWTPICGPLALATACFSGDDAAALRGGDAYAALPPMDYGFLGSGRAGARDASPPGPAGGWARPEARADDGAASEPDSPPPPPPPAAAPGDEQAQSADEFLSVEIDAGPRELAGHVAGRRGPGEAQEQALDRGEGDPPEPRARPREGEVDVEVPHVARISSATSRARPEARRRRGGRGRGRGRGGDATSGSFGGGARAASPRRAAVAAASGRAAASGPAAASGRAAASGAAAAARRPRPGAATTPLALAASARCRRRHGLAAVERRVVAAAPARARRRRRRVDEVEGVHGLAVVGVDGERQIVAADAEASPDALSRAHSTPERPCVSMTHTGTAPTPAAVADQILTTPRLPWAAPQEASMPWCARYASAADSAAIAGIAAAVASGDGFTFAITALVVFAWDLVVVRPDDIWPRRYVRAAAFAVVAAVTLARLPPETRAAHGAAGAATAALFPCVIKSRPNLVVNTAFACAWHAATARGALYALGLRE